MTRRWFIWAALVAALSISAVLLLPLLTGRNGSAPDSEVKARVNKGETARPGLLAPAPDAAGTPEMPEVPEIPEIREKLRILSEIFAKRNDNDQRLDSEFRVLSDAMKRAMRREYTKLAPEKRNERGTIVFLLGKELKTSEDFAFLNEVLSERPCLSMADCTLEAKNAGAAHAETGLDVSLAYPQIVALKRVEKTLEENYEAGQAGDAQKSALVAEAMHSVRIARSSRAPIVVRIANDLERRFPQK